MQSSTSWHSRHSLGVGNRLYTFCSSCKHFSFLNHPSCCNCSDTFLQEKQCLSNTGRMHSQPFLQRKPPSWSDLLRLPWDDFCSADKGKWLSGSRSHWVILPKPIEYILDSFSDEDQWSVCSVTEFLPKTNLPEHNGIPSMSNHCRYITGLSWTHLQGNAPHLLAVWGPLKCKTTFFDTGLQSFILCSCRC